MPAYRAGPAPARATQVGQHMYPLTVGGVGQFPSGKYPLAAPAAQRAGNYGPADYHDRKGTPTFRLGNHAPADYALGRVGQLQRHVDLATLGDDAVNSIRVYVPRLHSGIHALELRRTGKTYEFSPPATPFAVTRWNNDLATVFNQWAGSLLGFVPVIHEPVGADVIFVHMLGATTHAEAEAMWRPLQQVFNMARRDTGTPAPSDPYAGRPRAWEAPAPPRPPVVQPRARGGGMDAVVGAALVIVSLVL